MNQKMFIPLIAVFSTALLINTLDVSRSGTGGHVPVSVPVPADTAIQSPQVAQSRIQIVFALDATGSMGGLIGAAKEKIWSIAGSLAQADPAPVIEIGLLFYRDKGDAFVTRKVALSSDLDDIYAQLMQIDANGGGDRPESVNQALHEAVTHFQWDRSDKTYKAVFLVGDCPPHMDYQDDVKYPVSCSLAKEKDIILNTILMGGDRGAMRIWREIANCSQGTYAQVDMNANDIAVHTPYDDRIADISDRLDATRIYFGSTKDKSVSSEKVAKGLRITSASKSNVKAQRAEYNASGAGKEAYYGKQELLEYSREDVARVDQIKEEELPEEMKRMSVVERRAYVKEKLAERDSLTKELQLYMQKRQDYITKDLKERSAAEVDSSFSNRIYKSIQQQTEKKNIRIKGGAKY
ncbi:vWA domain-containing protein [Chitinophaga rhizophila]|uniref:VWA domain-containing protein n=1 Tax=Chitinophaga rhizophila TaxID=2866212 RepID=A0ABS7GKS2_9BACT|nr:vWA domain-containing protein [Chitinophaga rhizophila]MBW8687996.1 VWA domain-containing protein [Chitinophaga rhizophila]